MMLYRLGEFQLQMTLSGFFVRGAVAIGEIYMDDDIVFGPALIEAHKAEQKKARDPRIILTESARDQQYVKLNAAMPEGREHDVLLKDVDGQLFINYLQKAVEFEHDVGDYASEYLKKHRDHIHKRLTRFVIEPYIWSKYYWCATYHNFFCMGRTEFKDFIINLEAMAPQPQRIDGS